MSVQSYLANMVSETTVTQGTGTYNLEGPAAGFRSFRSQFGTGTRVAYVCQQIQYDGEGNVTGIYFEAGRGTLTHGSPDTIARTEITDSTNGGAAVDWGEGTKTIWCAAPGELLVLLEAALTEGREGRPLVVNPASDGFTTGNPSLGQQASSELTISSGSVTPTRAFHTVDTESDEASDDLVAIATTNIAEGGVLLLTAAHAARTVVVKHAASPSAGQIFLLSEADYSLDDATKCLALQLRGDHWIEVWRGSGKVALSDMADLAEHSIIVGGAGNRPAAEPIGASKILGRGAEGGVTGFGLGARLAEAAGAFAVSGLKIYPVSKPDVFSTGNTSWTDITDLSITLTPKSVGSKFLLLFSGLLANSNNGVGTHVRFVRESTAIGVGAAAGSRVQASATTTSSTSSYGDGVTAMHLDEPAAFSAITYKMQMRVGGGTGYLGRTWADSDGANSGRVPASLVVFEIEDGNQ